MTEHDQKKNEQKNEIRRMKRLLEKMAEMAEHVEQTGSFESGIQNSVKRYNTIVEHLEDRDILAEDVFPELDEDSDSGQLGAEARLLADYLTDIIEEDPERTKDEDANEPGVHFSFKKRADTKKPDLGMMVALAPFLERNELTSMVLKHFAGHVSMPEEPAAPTPPDSNLSGPDLQTIIALAPHVDQATLGQMVRACLTHRGIDNPQQLVALAPHMNSVEFSQLLRDYLPAWFGSASTPQPAKPDPAAAASAATSGPSAVPNANEEESFFPVPPSPLR